MSIVGTEIPASLRHGLVSLREETAQSGQAWIVQFMCKEGPGIMRLLWRLLGHEQDVLDAYQDCICRLAVRGRSGSVRSIRPYAYKTAANIAIELIRRRRRQRAHMTAVVAHRGRSAEDAVLCGAGAVEKAEMIQRLREAILELPPHLREVVMLRDLGEQPYRSVARIMGIQAATARVYRRQAIMRLAGLLGER